MSASASLAAARSRPWLASSAMESEKIQSWLDGKDTIVIDYSSTSILAKVIRDEIREVEPGVYLGKVWWGKMRILDFALTRHVPD